MQDILKFLAVAAGMLVVAAPTLAHHSRAATFDPENKVTLSGVVTSLEWRNPHIWVFFDVQSDDGAITRWACEGGAPNALFRRGWRPKSLQPGDEITIEGEVARNGSANCNMRSVMLADGTRVFAGDAGDADEPSGQ